MGRTVALLVVLLWSSVGSAQELYLHTDRSSQSPFGHCVVGVSRESGDQPVFIHQVVWGSFWRALAGRTSSTMEKTRLLGRRDRAFKLAVTPAQAQRVRAQIDQLAGQNTGRFHFRRNNCATTAARVLRTAGLQPPRRAWTPRRLGRWFRSLGGKR